MEEAKIRRINELSRLARERELTDAEKAEREALRDEYRAGFRRSLVGNLESTYIMDEHGNKVKVEKIIGN